MTVVYHPCAACAGLGSHAPTQYGSTAPYIPPSVGTVKIEYGPRIICSVCGGSGKGQIKEIREP